MKRIAATLAATVALASAAWAAEMEAVVKSFDPATKTVTLEDGTTWTVADGLDAALLATGTKIMVTVDDATKTVTAIAAVAQ
jgi:NADPH-dependent 2,4-dienoyl-CoA reductase/sulfur reductase-like enzyme